MSEIHLIQAIGKNPEANITELGRITGVTKGAVSQIVNKLEKNGLITKTNKNDNDKEIYPKLTEKGEVAFYNHEEVHKKLYLDIQRDFHNVTDEQILFVKNVFKKTEGYIEDYLETGK